VNNLVSEATARFTGTPPQFHKSESALTKPLSKHLMFDLWTSSTNEIKLI